MYMYFNLCYPNGKDLDSDGDWRFQEETCGYSNDGSSFDIYAGESVNMLFNLTAGCSASAQESLSAEVRSDGTALSASSIPLNIKRANLSISATPDRFDIGMGDEIAWTILLKNDGDGAAYSVLVETALGSGLQLLAIDSPERDLEWRYARIGPGAIERVVLKARVISTQDSYSTAFKARWGPGPCQEIGQLSELEARTAIRKHPDLPRCLAVGDKASYEISADLPAGARNLWINDTIAGGLTYNQSSLSVQGHPLQREILVANSDGSSEVCWQFADTGPAQTIEIGYNCQLMNAAECQDGVMLAGTKACMSWMNGSVQSTDADKSGALRVVEPELILEMQYTRPFACEDDRITYLLTACHSQQSHAPAYDVDLQALLPGSLSYIPGSVELLAGPDASFDDKGLKWHFDVVDQSWNADQKILIRFNATSHASFGEEIASSARITWTSLRGTVPEERTGAGGLDDYLRSCSASVSAIALSIRKTADPNPAMVGETLEYILTYENLGGEIAHNVTIQDEMDPRVLLLSADPAPSDANNTWQVPQLSPDGPHQIILKVHVSDTLEDGASLQNRFSIRCDELGSRSGAIYTHVQNGTRLAVNKTALQKAVRRGEEVSYIIRICNGGGRPATNVTVRDVFDSKVEFVSAWPQTVKEGVWRIDRLDPGECAEMGLTVRVPFTDVMFESHQSVRGEGFVSTHRDYTTSRLPSELTNHVHVSSDQMQLSASANVKILGEEGTDLSLRTHGSGEFEDEEDLRFLSANKSIRLDRSMSANYHTTAFALPGNGQLEFSSPWSEEVRARNGITNTTFQESYRQSTHLDCIGRFEMDKNESIMDISSNFRGVAHFKAHKLPLNSSAGGGDINSVEDYAGDFRIVESLHDMGQGLLSDRSASGTGYVARDSVMGTRQRSHESGTGAYRSDERIDTTNNFMYKDLNASFFALRLNVTPRTSLNISRKWAEGMWSRGCTGFIGEEYSGARRLKKSTLATSLSEMESEADFSGTAELQAAYEGDCCKNGSMQVDRDERLVGDYVVKRKIMISKASLFDRPHLHIQKDGRLVKDGWQGNDVAVYTITITNDGNAALGPLFLQDIFPEGASFINATVRPTKLGPNSSNWTLLHLSIGDTVRIGIDLDVEGCEGDIINRAAASGNCSAGLALAENMSIIDTAWLGGCAPATEHALLPEGIACACLAEEAANETEYFDPVRERWDDSSCPLDCSAQEDAHRSAEG
jgi:uncharacterized repeat protein (TIGR01451 family)